MPIVRLRGRDDFPLAERAGRDGLLAVGGDLSPRRLLRAYGRGIFPWYGEDEPILWWSPAPRFVLFPAEFHAGSSLQKVLKRGLFNFTLDRDFAAVIDGCALPRPGAPGEDGAPGTWITTAMRAAYIELHRRGYAHSLEAWHEGRLAGGLYGVSLGSCFFAESMFHLEDNASKAVLATLVTLALRWGFGFIDCQVPSPHLVAWGARSIPRRRYLELLRAGLRCRSRRGNWGDVL